MEDPISKIIKNRNKQVIKVLSHQMESSRESQLKAIENCDSKLSHYYEGEVTAYHNSISIILNFEKDKNF